MQEIIENIRDSPISEFFSHIFPFLYLRAFLSGMLSCEMSGGHRKEASIRSWEEEDVHIGPGATNPAMMFFLSMIILKRLRF